MKYQYETRNVCSSRISFELENDRLSNVRFQGGCNGNLKAIGILTEGMEAEKVVSLLKGNTCGLKSTSCADQLAIAIEKARLREKEKARG